MAETPLTLRVFVSSPSDVTDERRVVREVVDSLEANHLLRGRVRIDLVRWDDEDAPAPMDASDTPQVSVTQFVGRPSQCDLTLVILWGRLGTILPQEIVRADGSRYESGTVWEYEDALDARKRVFVYRRNAGPIIAADDPESERKQAEYEEVKRFFKRFENEDGSLKRGINRYKDVDDFRKLLRSHLEAFVSERLRALETNQQRLHEGARPRHGRWRAMAAVTAAAIVLATGAFAYWSRGGNTSAKGQTPIAERPQFAVAGSLSATGVERTPVRQAFPLFHDHRNCTDNRSAWSNHELCLDDRSARVERAVLAENPANAVAAALKRPECFHAESVSETKLSQATPSCATVTAKLYECNLPCGLQPGLNRSSYSIALEGYTTRPAQLEPHVFTRAATRERTLTIQYAKDIPSTVSPTAWKWSVQVTEMDTGRETVLTETQRSEGRLISQFNEKTRTLLLVFP